MKRLLPSSLLGQVMASVALALLVAQIVSTVLLYRAGEERRETAILTAAAFQLSNGAELAERDAALQAELRAARRADRRAERRGPRRELRRLNEGLRNGDRGNLGRPGGLPRPLRYTISRDAPIALPPASGEGSQDGTAEGQREERLRAALIQQGIDPHSAIVAIRLAGEDPLLLEFAETRPRFQRRDAWRHRDLFIAAIQREPGGQWEAARILAPSRPQSALGVLLFQTMIIFVFLILILFLVLRRITRPLDLLTQRVGNFSRQPERAVLLEESGPSDTRRLIAAHNAMETRIAALLDEKDVMLGAIGHDLKTPLAALRVRIESVTDEVQRAKMAASIEDITATLDDILSLSRIGRDGEGTEAVDLSALAIGVAEEFEDLGEPVTIAEPERLVAQVQITWVRRALRNLVSNAVRYGEAAEISLIERDGAQGESLAVLRVDDRGPGIAPDQIAAMFEPFTRGEVSRNRATGGAGLGLTLARAIAEQHGGALVLENREVDGNVVGLRAELQLPLRNEIRD